MPTAAPPEPVIQKPKRRWLQFRLRTLLGVVTLAGIGLGLFVVPAERQRRAIAAVIRLRGQLWYEEGLLPKRDPARERAWYRKLLGDDYFCSIVRVNLGGDRQLRRPPLTIDAELEHLEAHLLALTRLQTLDLGDSQVTDAGLEHVKGLTQLEGLDLGGAKVTDAGLARLEGLSALHALDLRGAMVSDAGLKHLNALTALEWLDLRDTQVTDTGLAKLRDALPDCEIFGP